MVFVYSADRSAVAASQDSDRYHDAQPDANRRILLERILRNIPAVPGIRCRLSSESEGRTREPPNHRITVRVSAARFACAVTQIVLYHAYHETLCRTASTPRRRRPRATLDGISVRHSKHHRDLSRELELRFAVRLL